MLVSWWEWKNKIKNDQNDSVPVPVPVTVPVPVSVPVSVTVPISVFVPVSVYFVYF